MKSPRKQIWVLSSITIPKIGGCLDLWRDWSYETMNNLLGTVCWPTLHLSILSWVFMLSESYTRKPSMIYRAHSGAVGAPSSWNSNRELMLGTPNRKQKELAQNDTSLLKPHSQPSIMYIRQQGHKVTTASSQRATSRTPGIKTPETYQGKLTQATTMGNYRFYPIYGKTDGSNGGY